MINQAAYYSENWTFSIGVALRLTEGTTNYALLLSVISGTIDQLMPN
jgi:hypothetical protein